MPQRSRGTPCGATRSFWRRSRTARSLRAWAPSWPCDGKPSRGANMGGQYARRVLVVPAPLSGRRSRPPDAQRRLALLAAAFEPPPVFTPIDYDIGPPLPDEVEYLDQPKILFGGLSASAPPPPIPDFFLPPPSPDFDFIAPPPPVGPFFLPAPVVPFFAAAMVRPPPFVSPPPAAPI